MLQRLVIQNYALIESLDIQFSEGLSIITGETGAGKSILLGALSMILGQRADTQALLNKEKKCVVEGEFYIKSYALQDFFNASELEYADTTIIRREISPEGKSRAFVNDSPVNLNQLKELSGLLMDIHSQHETLSINKSDFQLAVVDAYAGHTEEVHAYRVRYRSFVRLKRELEDLVAKENQSKADLDYYQFLFQELEQSALDGIVQEELEQELEMLNHTGEIKSTLEKTLFSLQEGEVNLLNQLSETISSLNAITRFYQPSEELCQRIRTCHIELKDIAAELESAGEKTTYDPARVEELNTLLNSLYALQKKHRVSTVAELIAIRDELSGKLSHISTLEDQISELNARLEKEKEELTASARAVSARRAAALPAIGQDIKNLLQEVSMPNAVLRIEQKTEDALHQDGLDTVRFLFSANLGVDYRELHRVASGGELSRLMLCIKSLMAKLTALPTIIFDEIDTGISGEVAQKVGNVMQRISGNMQVIAITHLPQIASKGESHYFVFKEAAEGRTLSRIKTLTRDERVVEIAKMLSGENPTVAAMENARELLLS
jgi:DNA repair protein RecN (Recombination protein N)